jgi:hypothetical protein
MRRLAVPVVVEGNIPRQVSSEFDVVGRIQVEFHATGVGEASMRSALTLPLVLSKRKKCKLAATMPNESASATKFPGALRQIGVLPRSRL